MSQTSVITGLERRRRWSEEQKLQLLTAAFGPGGSVAEVARRADICTSLLYRWRQVLKTTPAPTSFVPAILNEDAATSAAPAAAIYVMLPGRASVSIAPGASPALVAAALGALR